MAAGGEFVEGWLVAQVLGEGAYGEVRLLVHARTGARVALKAVGGGGGGGAAREAALHRALRHAHVLRCLGERAHAGTHYLFLEYAPGGELFERIEPDVGMAEGCARRYWRQLAAGLRYLHARGVAHRDIKPENLLLDHRDRIKISDFGMATVFRHGARERLMSRLCGTVPYAAPEVLTAPERPYRAPPADVWAAAVVMVAMLAGELPWGRASESDGRFAWWCAQAGEGDGEGETETEGAGVWRRGRLSAGARRWLRRALRPAAAERARLADLLLDRWLCEEPPRLASEGARVCMSQPAARAAEAEGEGDDEAEGGARDLTPADMDALLSYSQPAHSDDLLLADPAAGAAWGADGGAGVARRLARVWVTGGAADALRAVGGALRAAGWPVRRLDARTLAVECGAEEVRMRAWVAGAARGAALVQFGRWRGCGLQFQRRFLELRAALAPIAAPEPAPRPQPMDEDHT